MELSQERWNSLSARLHMPLTEVIRPQNFAQYIGQEHLLNAENGTISNYFRLGYLPSMVLGGPPGVGKTSLARLLANKANYVFVELSATSSTVGELRELLGLIETENLKRHRLHIPRLRVLVFIDEIHRFSKVQQDFLLPFIESGTFVFIGATTVDPKKSMRRAILSRCHSFTLVKLQDLHLEKVAHRAILYENIRRKAMYNLRFLDYSAGAVSEIARNANGDMRAAVNLIELIGSRLRPGLYTVYDESSESIKVDESTVTSFIKTLSKARFGLHSPENLSLLAHFLKCLQYPESSPLKDTNRVVNKSKVGPSVTPTTPPPNLQSDPDAESSPYSVSNSDSESWMDYNETPYSIEESDPRLVEWARHIPYSDDEEGESGPIYSDPEDGKTPITPPDLSSLSASKFRILSATHACLQLFEKGESPLSILKYLILFACTHFLPEKNELVNIFSALKAGRKSGVDAEHLLLNCIERLAGKGNSEPVLLRSLVEAAKEYCLGKQEHVLQEDTVPSASYQVIYDSELVETLLRELPKEETEPMHLGMAVVPEHELGPEYTCGEDVGAFYDPTVLTPECMTISE